MTLRLFTLAVAVGLLLAEARVSRQNDARLDALGAVAPPGDVYMLLAVLYPLAFVVMGVEGVWRAALAADPAAAPGPGPSWYAAGLLLFGAAKALKYWAIASLGERWSFKVRVLPGRPLVRTGPYRHVDHPNYVAVVGEFAGMAMMMGAGLTGPVMLAAFGAALWARVRFENRCLRPDLP